MTDYALVLENGHLRAPRLDQTIWVSTAHGIQSLVKVDPKRPGDASAKAGAVSAKAGDTKAEAAALEAQVRILRQELLAPKTPNSLRAYNADLRDFNAYCQGQGLAALPAEPQTIVRYLLALVARGYKPSTILRRRMSISKAHQLAGHRIADAGDPLIKPLLRMLGPRLRLSANKAALDMITLRRLLRTTPLRTAAGARDRIMLLLGVAGGLRPSELVALDVGKLYVTDHRLRIRIPSTSTGHWQFGREVNIPRGEHAETCPVRAIRAWYAIAGIRSGALFRPVDRHGRVGAKRLTPRAVALVIKRAAQRAGLDPTLYAGQSLRAGLVTAAAAGGAPERVILAQTGLQSLSSVPRYMRRGSRLDREAAAYLGL